MQTIVERVTPGLGASAWASVIVKSGSLRWIFRFRHDVHKPLA
jgi:hypothetical protein